MKIRIILSIITIQFCLTAHAKTHTHVQLHNEKWALAKISALPEVKEFMRYAKKEKPEVIIANDPASTDEWCFWVKVGLSSGDMYHTNYNFLVDPKTSKIYIEQIELFLEPGVHTATLQQWRRWRSDPRFEEPHIFKNGKLIALKHQA